MMMTGGRPTRLQPATPGGQEHGTGRLWEPALRNSAPVSYPRMAETVFRPTTLKFITGAPGTAVDRTGPGVAKKTSLAIDRGSHLVLLGVSRRFF